MMWISSVVILSLLKSVDSVSMEACHMSFCARHLICEAVMGANGHDFQNWSLKALHTDSAMVNLLKPHLPMPFLAVQFGFRFHAHAPLLVAFQPDNQNCPAGAIALLPALLSFASTSGRESCDIERATPSRFGLQTGND